MDASDELARLRAAINEAYRIMCSGTPPHSAREVNARRVLRLAGARVTHTAGIQGTTPEHTTDTRSAATDTRSVRTVKRP